jgi:4-nitrophenyl phosphatase
MLRYDHLSMTSPSLPLHALLLDMDGTLLRGDEPIPGLTRLFDFLATRQLPYIIATNNATKSPQDYQRKLAKHGVRVPAESILTAAIATAETLRTELPRGASVYVIGQPALWDALQAVGFVCRADSARAVEAVVVGGDPSLTYDKLKHATLLLQRGARFIGTNPDVVYPTEQGLVPETGTTLAALQAATGIIPTVIGKPAPYLFQQAVGHLGSDPARTVVVGDRLETDILGGQRAGLKTILTTTGVDTADSIPGKGIQPDWVVDGLDELVDLLATLTSLSTNQH